VSDELEFVEEGEQEKASSKVWKMLVVDDEEDVHDVTKLVLKGFDYLGVPLEFLHARSGKESCEIMAREKEIAVILMDVVMETDHAGLEAIEYIRNELDNKFVRIILRTGQPGQAPEHDVITQYDINDYKHKTELTRQRLFTTIYTSISAYRDLIALDRNRRALKKIIESSAQLFDLRFVGDFSQAVLDQLIALLYLGDDAVVVRSVGVVSGDENANLLIVAATGMYQENINEDAREVLSEVEYGLLQQAIGQQHSVEGDGYFVAYFEDAAGGRHAFYVSADVPTRVQERELIELFCTNVVIAQENALLLKDAKNQ